MPVEKEQLRAALLPILTWLSQEGETEAALCLHGAVEKVGQREAFTEAMVTLPEPARALARELMARDWLRSDALDDWRDDVIAFASVVQDNMKWADR